MTIVYLLVNIAALLMYKFELIEIELFRKYYFIVGLVFFFLIYDIFYKNFRKNEMLILWGIIGLIQIIIYYTYKDYGEFQTLRGNCIRWLKATPATILVFYIFNLINKKLYGDNFIVTLMRITGKHEDIDERDLRPADFMFSFIGAIFVILVVIL